MALDPTLNSYQGLNSVNNYQNWPINNPIQALPNTNAHNELGRGGEDMVLDIILDEDYSSIAICIQIIN